MINKLYEKIKLYIKENYKFLLGVLVIFFLGTFKLPFFIDAPGGIINVNDKIEIENSNDINGSLNLSYVTELNATIPTYLFALLNKDYDIIPQEEMKYDNETIEEAMKRSDILLKESVSYSTYVAYKKANKEINITSSEVYVAYIIDRNTNDLKIGDQILKIDDIEIKSKEKLNEVLSKYNENDTINIKVKNDNKEYTRTAKMKLIDGKAAIGILISEVYDLETSPTINYKFDSSETGPSGGLMLTLAIYDYLTEEDLTRGRKIVGTGTIDFDGNVGQIGGVKYKLKGAIKNKADIFIVPAGENYDEVMNLVKENNYNIKIIKASNFDQVVSELKK